MKTAIVTDSNSGITQKQGEELGIYVLPMPFMVDGRTYLEGVDLTHQEFYEKMNGGADISTSQPSPDSVMKLWTDFSQHTTRLSTFPCPAAFPAPARRPWFWLRTMRERFM